MSSGLPVLFAGRGEGADIITESDCGVVVANRDDTISDAVESLCRDPEIEDVWRGNARAAVERSWSWDRQTDAWRQALDAMMKARA